MGFGRIKKNLARWGIVRPIEPKIVKGRIEKPPDWSFEASVGRGIIRVYQMGSGA